MTIHVTIYVDLQLFPYGTLFLLIAALTPFWVDRVKVY